jgi:hypothetical protein
MDKFRQKQKEEQAVQELAEFLCGKDDGRRIPKEAMSAAPAGYKAEDAGDLREEPGTEQVRVIKIDADSGTLQPLEQEKASDERTESEIVDRPEYIERDACEDESGPVRIYFPGMMIEEDQQSKINCRSLAMHNNAIDALDALIEDGIDDDAAAEKAADLLDRLRQVRMSTFEHMVPWAKIAREYK